MVIAVSIGNNDTWVAIHAAMIKPAKMTPVVIDRSSIMIQVTNIVTEVAANSPQLMVVI